MVKGNRTACKHTIERETDRLLLADSLIYEITSSEIMFYRMFMLLPPKCTP